MYNENELRIFIHNKVDKFNNRVAQFIYDSVEHIELIDDEIFKEKYLKLIDSIQDYESSRKEIDITLQCSEFNSICDRIRADVCDHR